MALALSAGTAGASAQSTPPFSFDPSTAASGTALVVAADATTLSRNGEPAESMAFALPRGTRLDAAARRVRCSAAQAAGGACPPASQIGFGRYIVDVAGFLTPGGDAQLTWSLTAFLGRPAQHGDPASVVVSATLLGADSVAQLLAPDLGTTVPRSATTIGRLVRRASGPYAVELLLPGLPVAFRLAAPVTAQPTTLELSLSAVRRVRQDFVRRYRIRTLSGYEVRKVRDHRLVGHDLLRTPSTCRGSWPYELRVGFADGLQRSSGRMPCLPPLSVGTSAARRPA